MALRIHSAVKTDYPFLARPPPQKKRPLQPLPAPPSPRSFDFASARRPRRESGTFSAIAAWAAHVKPGSPAPLSPRALPRHPSLRRNRCSSITTSFLHVAPTPTTAHVTTPSTRDFKADLTTVGYTSVFLQLPNTPTSATTPVALKPLSPNVVKSIPIPPVPSPTYKPRGFRRFRSLSVLRSRGKSKSVCLDSPTKMTIKAAAASAAIVKRKKAKYAMRPPPLVNELAFIQFTDGGSIDDNIKHVLEVQAKAASVVGVADVYRDGQGGVWWDQDEELEYAHLLSEDESRPHATGDLRWVTFGGNMLPPTEVVSGEARRGSVSTQDSDLDPKCIVQPIDSFNGNDLVPLATYKPTTSLPSRPRRDTKCLRKPDFLVDIAFLRLGVSSKSPTSAGIGAGISKPKGKARRRPAPLKLSPPIPGFKRPTNSPVDVSKARRDFIGASFEPIVSTPVMPTMPAMAISPTTPVNARGCHMEISRTINTTWRSVNDGLISLGMRTKPSMLNMIGHFKSVRKEDMSG